MMIYTHWQYIYIMYYAMYYIIYLHEDIHVYVLYVYEDRMYYEIHMEIYVCYVLWLHADTHVLCNIVTCRYARVMYYIYMKMSGGCEKESPR